MSAIILFALMIVTYVLAISWTISANEMQNYFIMAAIVSIVYYFASGLPIFNRA